MPKKSKKTSTKKSSNLNNSSKKGNLHEPVTNIVDYGEIPANTPQEKK